MLFESLMARSADATPVAEDVFATVLWNGSNSTNALTTGVNMTTAGGLIWSKQRQTVVRHLMFDTVRTNGLRNGLSPSNNSAPTAYGADQYTPTTTGITATSSSDTNGLNVQMAAWVFKRAAKYFDIVTWTGDGTSNRQIPHSLLSAPGMVVTRSSAVGGEWNTWHRSATGDLTLNGTAAQTASQAVVTAADATTFTVSGVANTNAVAYVAYLWGHNTASDGLVQCGSVTTDGSGNGSVTLGWEPGWLLIKAAGGTGDWNIIDEKRAWTADLNHRVLAANTATAETLGTATVRKNAGGFTLNGNTASTTFIYVAVRRGPMRFPTSGFSVLDIQGVGTTGGAIGNLAKDMFLCRWTPANTGNVHITDRLRGWATTGSPLIQTNATAAESTPTTAPYVFSNDTGNPSSRVNLHLSSVTADYLYYAFTRWAGFFDQICYTGTGAVQALTHGLRTTPTFVLVKCRTAVNAWAVYHVGLGATAGTDLSTAIPLTTSAYWNDTAPTDTTFTVGVTNSVNQASQKFTAYLFGDVPGVSKAGSYAGSASAVTVSCGFAPRFVMVKRTDTSGTSWIWSDAANNRGIVAANDVFSFFSTSTAHNTTSDWIDPVSGGFIINTGFASSNSGAGTSYIYWAIA